MSLDSMADILHCMEQEGKEFWEVVLAADMDIFLTDIPKRPEIHWQY